MRHIVLAQHLAGMSGKGDDGSRHACGACLGYHLLHQIAVSGMHSVKKSHGGYTRIGGYGLKVQSDGLHILCSHSSAVVFSKVRMPSWQAVWQLAGESSINSVSSAVMPVSLMTCLKISAEGFTRCIL